MPKVEFFDLLHALPRGLESWSERHAHTIALLEAISTTSAVIVALKVAFAAKRATRPRLKVSVSIREIIHGDGRPHTEWPSYVTARLVNIGTVPARLHSTFFSWRVRLRRYSALVLPIDEVGDHNVPPRKYPFVLEPNQSVTIFLTELETFRNEVLPRVLDEKRRRMATKRLRGVAYTDDNSLFSVRFDLSFRKELTQFVKSRRGHSSN